MLLDQAILERMERDDDQATTRREDQWCCEQQRVNLAQLIVYGNPQRLKRACRRVFVWLSLRDRSGHHGCQRERIGDTAIE